MTKFEELAEELGIKITTNPKTGTYTNECAVLSGCAVYVVNGYLTSEFPWETQKDMIKKDFLRIYSGGYNEKNHN